MKQLLTVILLCVSLFTQIAFAEGDLTRQEPIEVVVELGTKMAS